MRLSFLGKQSPDTTYYKAVNTSQMLFTLWGSSKYKLGCNL